MSGNRILLVDDTMENIQVAGTILKENGYQLNIARNGIQALRVCEKTTPDLILLDIMMPEMDGFQCCEKLKADERLKDIPIIFLTANTETADVVKGFEKGAVDYIFKPFNAPELLSRISTHLALRKAHLDLEDLTEKASRHICPHVFRALFTGEKGTVPKTTTKPLTVFSSGICDFTKLTEPMGDEDLTTWLNDYCDRMAKQVLEYGGTLDRLIGDAVTAFFGDPGSKGEKEDAIACVRMALEMIQEAEEMNIQIRAGLNSGPAFVGIFGAQQQMTYSALGNTVSLASRIESISDPGKVLISQATYDLVKDDFWCEERGPIKVKGIDKAVMTYWVNA